MTRVLLRAASWIVPHSARSGWLAEWTGELAFIAHTEPARAFAFALGAFRDAICVRGLTPRAPLLASPVQTLAVLSVLAAAAFLCRPAAGIPEDLISIRPHRGRSTVTFNQYRHLAEHPPAGFTAIAFYTKTPAGVVASASIHDVLRGAKLPGRLGAYTIREDPSPAPGYVLARASVLAPGPWWHVSVPSTSGGKELLDCVPISNRMPNSGVLVIFAIAIIMLPTISTFALGESARGPRLWTFFAVKVALSLIAACFGSQAIAALIGPAMTAHAMLVAMVLTLRWAFNDQRRRCPTCLRLLASPVSFGCLGHILLDWHGSEFICPEGHGLLQVSASPTSPYAAQHWLPL